MTKIISDRELACKCISEVIDALEQVPTTVEAITETLHSPELQQARAKTIAKHRTRPKVNQQLINALDEYCRLLGAEIDELASFASSHHWKSSRYEAGVAAREKIAALRGKLV
jgi:hypothetical protein